MYQDTYKTKDKSIFDFLFLATAYQPTPQGQ